MIPFSLQLVGVASVPGNLKCPTEMSRPALIIHSQWPHVVMETLKYGQCNRGTEFFILLY